MSFSAYHSHALFIMFRSHILLPNEQVLYSSPIYTKSRRSLLPAKRRVLVLTDLPRLLCVKEDRNARLSIKSDVVFTPAVASLSHSGGNAGNARPIVLSKISEDGRSEENVAVLGAPLGSSGLSMTPVRTRPSKDSVADTAQKPVEQPVPQVSSQLVEAEQSDHPDENRKETISSNLLQGVEGRGDKIFIVRTVSFNMTISHTARVAQFFVGSGFQDVYLYLGRLAGCIKMGQGD